MKRTVTPELLDTDDWAAPSVDTALADLLRITRYFGGISSMTAILERVARAAGLRRLSFLDVAGASGDVARRAGERLRRRGIELQPVIMDRAPSHLRSMTRTWPAGSSAGSARHGATRTDLLAVCCTCA